MRSPKCTYLLIFPVLDWGCIMTTTLTASSHTCLFVSVIHGGSLEDAIVKSRVANVDFASDFLVKSSQVTS